MNWFYALNGQQAGPVDEAELARLAGAGTITPATLVWRSGMTQWQPYSEARRPIPPVDPAATAPTTTAAATTTAASAPTIPAGQAQCSQCGRVLPAAGIVRVDGRNVCGDCQPLLPRRGREAAPAYQPTLSTPFYAEFGIRLGAAFLDGVILLPVYFGLWFALWFLLDLPILTTAGASQPDDVAHLTRSMLPFSIGLQCLLASYSAFCLGRFGGTPGKRMCNLRVVHGTDGGRVTFLRGLGRYAAKVVPRSLPGLLWLDPMSFALLCLAVCAYVFADALCIVFDAENRSLHDRICNTRVVAETPAR